MTPISVAGGDHSDWEDDHDRNEGVISPILSTTDLNDYDNENDGNEGVISPILSATNLNESNAIESIISLSQSYPIPKYKKGDEVFVRSYSINRNTWWIASIHQILNDLQIYRFKE
ncbi:hypothetical protein CYY_010146 [Polysphondylium violaceum]|uniref:Uncharacterized protein n=1 Tax=Polysphondylium violaceum TaxID=133409 RepID=A0A8J4PK97_9MYCE|nr:hypothetical protein CYY_010146 [Polysphondylium violaceum]